RDGAGADGLVVRGAGDGAVARATATARAARPAAVARLRQPDAGLPDGLGLPVVLAIPAHLERQSAGGSRLLSAAIARRVGIRRRSHCPVPVRGAVRVAALRRDQAGADVALA